MSMCADLRCMGAAAFHDTHTHTHTLLYVCRQMSSAAPRGTTWPLLDTIVVQQSFSAANYYFKELPCADIGDDLGANSDHTELHTDDDERLESDRIVRLSAVELLKLKRNTNHVDKKRKHSREQAKHHSAFTAAIHEIEEELARSDARPKAAAKRATHADILHAAILYIRKMRSQVTV